MPRLACAVLMLSLAACGEGPMRSAERMSAFRDKGKEVAPGEGEPEAKEFAPRGVRVRDAKADEPQLPRKIIYTGQVAVQVTEYAPAMEKLAALLQEVNGYISSSEETGSPGSPRQAVWVVRVPAKAAEKFRSEVAKLGEVTRNTLSSEDVTETYYDAKAEVANKEAEEKLPRDLNDKLKATKPSELVEWTRALAAVRGEINMRLGQIRRWDKLTAFTTLTITISERTRYVPTEAPSLGTRIGRAWTDSLSALSQVGQGLLVVLVAVLPWAVVLAIVALPITLAWRGRPPLTPVPPAGLPATLPMPNDSDDSPPTVPPE